MTFWTYWATERDCVLVKGCRRSYGQLWVSQVFLGVHFGSENVSDLSELLSVGLQARKGEFPQVHCSMDKPLVFLGFKIGELDLQQDTKTTKHSLKDWKGWGQLTRLQFPVGKFLLFELGGIAQCQKQRHPSGAQVAVAEASQGGESAWGTVQSCSRRGIKLFSSCPVTNYVYLGSEPLLIWAGLLLLFLMHWGNLNRERKYNQSQRSP